MNPFCHCHAHTTYSALDGYGTAKQWADRVQELDLAAHAVTDHGVVTAHAPLAKEFRARGLKLVFGMEGYVVDDLAERTREQASIGANAFPHVTLLALTGRGYENLLRLHNLAWREGFYYKPRLDWAAIARHQEGLAVLSGCPLGYPTQLVLAKGPEAARDFLAARSREIERFYVELVPSPGLDLSERSLAWLGRAASELRLPPVLTSDAHFPRPEDHAAEDALLAVGTGQPAVAGDRKMRLEPYYYACTPAELLERARAVVRAGCIDDVAARTFDGLLQDGLRNAARLAAEAEVELPRAKPVFFQAPDPGVPRGGLEHLVSAAARLRSWAEAGLRDRYDQGLLPAAGFTTKDYHDRLALELEVLNAKGFCDYMLIVIDLIRELRRRGALVITRGSAGGCLLLWLTGASVTDPLRHDLMFERFFDDTRDDAPDVDIDFSERWRPAAIDYLFERYGRDNCAQIANFNTLGAKQALKDAAFALGAGHGEAELVGAALTSASDDVVGQLAAAQDARVRAVLARRPELAPLAQRLVGQVRNQGIHAAGVLVSPEPLDGRVGLMRGAGGQVVAAVDKRGAKQLGYLKIDVLAVRTLDVLEGVLQRLGRDQAWLETLPLDDPDALRLAREGWLSGIFQLDGPAAWRVAKEIGLDTFTDVAMASALCRPGPGDWVPTYARNKADWHYLALSLGQMHPTAQQIVKPTFGLVVTQEQVMRLAWDLAGWSNIEVHTLRRDISDKLGTQPDLEARAAWKRDNLDRWVRGCAARGVGEAEATRWWATIETHGGYSFNKSHCWTYAVVGYWMLWLKAHHPAEFYEAYLAVEPDPIVAKRLIREFRALGGKVELLDPTSLAPTFHSPRPGVLAGGLTNLKGVGPAVAAKLAAKGPFAGWGWLLAACTPVLGARLQAAVAETLGAGGAGYLLQVAPWHPVPALPQSVAEARARHRLPTINRLAELPKQEARVLAYVSATGFSPTKVVILLEDETNFVAAKVSARDLAATGPAVRALKAGDLVAATGWWSGDCLYLKSVKVVREAPKVVAEKAKRRTK